MKRCILLFSLLFLLPLLFSCTGEGGYDPLSFRAPPCSFSGTAKTADGKKTDFTVSFDAEGTLSLTVTSDGALKGAVYTRTENGTVLVKDGITLPLRGDPAILGIFSVFSLSRPDLISTERRDGTVPLLLLTFPDAVLTLREDSRLPCRFQTGGTDFTVRDFLTNSDL